MALIDENDAALALPGGAGTLAEIAVMWNHLLTRAVPPRPLILIGSGWRGTFTTLFEQQGTYISEADRTWLTFVPDVPAAFQKLQAALNRQTREQTG
jgi:predicted Rossmann-fold nucleotide-binding protein